MPDTGRKHVYPNQRQRYFRNQCRQEIDGAIDYLSLDLGIEHQRQGEGEKDGKRYGDNGEIQGVCDGAIRPVEEIGIICEEL